MQCDKGDVFKAKRFGKKETATKKDECSFMIIITRNNKIGFWFLAIANAIHNHPHTLLGAYPIYSQLARTDKVKELIVPQTRVEASSKQVIAAIWTSTDKENPLVKPKNVYKERAAHSVRPGASIRRWDCSSAANVDADPTGYASDTILEVEESEAAGYFW